MKTKSTLSLIFLLFVLFFSAAAFSEVPHQITFQGKLFEADSTPVNGIITMNFSVGSWTDVKDVEVNDGFYSVVLAVPDTAFDHADVKLNIQIGGENLSPDTKFLSVPYAYRAINSENLDGNSGTYYLQTLSIDGNQLSISNGNTVTLPAGNGGTVQDLVLTNDTLKITENANASPIDLTHYIQDLNLNDDTLTITKNDNATKLDLKPYKQTLSLDGGDLSISNGNTVSLSMVEQDPKVGNLTTNYIPRWDADSNSLQNSVIFTENDKIGIGLTSMEAKLDIAESNSGRALRAYNNANTGIGAEFAITQSANNDAALRAFTQGSGYAAWISVNDISNSAAALFVSTIGSGPAGKFSANTQLAAVDVQNDNVNATSIGVKSFCQGVGVSGITNAGKGVEGRATVNGIGVYGWSNSSYGGVFETGAINTFALKSAGDFWCTSDAKIDGNVGIGGDPNATYRLYVYGDAYATGNWQTSDETLKTNIKPISSALDKVMRLNGVQYEWIDKKRYGSGMHIGFLAQELKNVFPQLVKYDGKNYAVQYAPLTAVLAESIKELKKENDELRKANSKLAKEIETLKTMMLGIQSQLKK